MRAAILSIGSELMHGFLTDTNATFLTQELQALGVDVVSIFGVGDDLPRIIRTFERALEDADIVVATGGIGPTDDDLTREAVAAVRGEQVVVDPVVEATILGFFQARGGTMPSQNRKQAWIIPSATLLHNPMGTAPGWLVQHGDRRIVIMPGVPREMRRMWQEQAVPLLLPTLGSAVIVSRTIKTIGIGESALETAILPIIRSAGPIVATYAKDDGVHVRISAVGDVRDEVEAAVNATEDAVREVLAQYMYGGLDTTLADAVLFPLARAGTRLHVTEVGSAGLLRNTLEDSDHTDTVVAQTTVLTWSDGVTRFGDLEPLQMAEEILAQSAAEATGGTVCALVVHAQSGDTRDRTTGDITILIARNGAVVHREHRVTAIIPEIRRRAVMWTLDFLWATLRDAEAALPE